MSKDTRPQTPKQMQVKVLVPWVIILVLAALFIGMVTGWTARSSQVNEVRAQVAQELQVATPVKK